MSGIKWKNFKEKLLQDSEVKAEYDSLSEERKKKITFDFSMQNQNMTEKEIRNV